MQLLLVAITKDMCSCLSVEKDEADRQKAGHSEKGLGKKALDPSTSCSGSNSVPLPREKKNCVCPEVRIPCPCLEIE